MNNKLQNQNLESLFFKDSALDNEKVDKIVSNSLANADDGELYLQFEESENFVFKLSKISKSIFCETPLKPIKVQPPKAIM